MNRLHTVTETGSERAQVGYEAIFIQHTMFIVIEDLGLKNDVSLADDIEAVAADLQRVIVGVCKSTVFCKDRVGYYSQLVCVNDKIELQSLGNAISFKEAKDYWTQNKAQ